METLCFIAHGLNRGLFEVLVLGNGFNHLNQIVGLNEAQRPVGSP